MPAISFSVLKDKLLSGEKCQTVRKPRKRPLKVGDVLKVYWKQRTKECEFLGVTKIVKIVRKRIDDFTEDDATKDGFEPTCEGLYLELTALNNMHRWFLQKYHDINGDTEFDIITFETLKKEA